MWGRCSEWLSRRILDISDVRIFDYDFNVGLLMEERKAQLELLLTDLLNSLTAREKRYFHCRTTENLIFHFGDIKSESDKNWVYETLVEYFRKCTEANPTIDRAVSVRLYYQYLEKLTQYYETQLRFSMLLNRGMIYTVYFAILVLSIIFFNLYVVAGVLALVVVLVFRSFQKFKERRVYGLFF